MDCFPSVADTSFGSAVSSVTTPILKGATHSVIYKNCMDYFYQGYQTVTILVFHFSTMEEHFIMGLTANWSIS